MTRVAQNPRLASGEIDIASIQFNPRSRDDIPQILRGLQHIYLTDTLREAVFALLEKNLSEKVNIQTGRPGMSLWEILVMGVLRLDLNCDYDRLHNLVNEHMSIRKMLGHVDCSDSERYGLQTIKDNVRFLSPELLEELNQIIAHAGQALVEKKGKASSVLRGRCDSFVVETHVHYPTDIGLLYDALRKVIELNVQLCSKYGWSDWRQWRHNLKQVKRKLRIAQKKKRGGAKSLQKKEKQEEAIKQAHEELLELGSLFLLKSSETVKKVRDVGQQSSLSELGLLKGIEEFRQDALRQIDQTRRRVLQGEKIAQEEKVYSIFQRHTEWICKGKAGVAVELGLRVCILEDHHGFILTHKVMEKQTDSEVAVEVVSQAKNHFPGLDSCSFDKGFHSPANQEALAKQLKTVALKRKGKLSKTAKDLESSESFKQAAHKHSAVESAINALEVHGLDRCPDHGIEGFKRYVGLAVLSRNIHRIGAVLHEKAKCKANRARDKLLLFAA